MVVMEAVVCGAVVLNGIILRGVSSLPSTKYSFQMTIKLNTCLKMFQRKTFEVLRTFLDFEGRICCRAFALVLTNYIINWQLSVYSKFPIIWTEQVPSHKLDEQKQTVDLLIVSVLCITIREGARIMQERLYFLSWSNLFFENGGTPQRCSY